MTQPTFDKLNLCRFEDVIAFVDSCDLTVPLRPEEEIYLSIDGKNQWFEVENDRKTVKSIGAELPDGFYVCDVETYADTTRLAIATCWDILNQRWLIWSASEDYQQRLKTGKKILGIAHRSTFEHSFFEPAYYIDSQIRWLCTHVMACQKYHPIRTGMYRAMPYLPMFRESNDLSLKELAERLCGIVLDKDAVEVFIDAKTAADWRNDERATVTELFTYNVTDVQTTLAVFNNMWVWYKKLPLPYIAGLFHRSASFVPLAADWFEQVEKIEAVYKDRLEQISEIVTGIEAEYIDLMEPYHDGLESQQISDSLDWKVWGPTCKDKTKIGRYKWQGVGFNSKKLMAISRLSWDGRPLYLVPEDKRKDGEVVIKKDGTSSTFYRWHTCDSNGDWLSSVTEPKNPRVWDNPNNTTGELKDTTGVFSKMFLPHWKGVEENSPGRLTSESVICQEVANIFSTISYWQGFRGRVISKLPILKTEVGFVAMPRPLVAGTATNRSIDPIMLTMSKPDFKKVGSELYNYICAPAGYKLVQADLDSIQNVGAALIAAIAKNYYDGKPLVNIDCMNNEFSKMTLLGNKHSRTTVAWQLAIQMGLNNDYGYSLGKNALYAMLFGVGLEKLGLMMGSLELADKTLRYFKGVLNKATRKYTGGIASDYFNFLSELADGLLIFDGDTMQSDNQRSLFLGRKMSNIFKLSLRGKDFRGTANNSILQGLDVDCLCFMVDKIVRKCDQFGLDVKYCQSVHDMKMFLCPDSQVEKLLTIFQWAHQEMYHALLSKLGVDISTFPEASFFYSGVEVSQRWVKSLKDNGKTLSNLDGFDPEVSGFRALEEDEEGNTMAEMDLIDSKTLKATARAKFVTNVID